MSRGDELKPYKPHYRPVKILVNPRASYQTVAMQVVMNAVFRLKVSFAFNPTMTNTGTTSHFMSQMDKLGLNGETSWWCFQAKTRVRGRNLQLPFAINSDTISHCTVSRSHRRLTWQRWSSNTHHQ